MRDNSKDVFKNPKVHDKVIVMYGGSLIFVQYKIIKVTDPSVFCNINREDKDYPSDYVSFSKVDGRVYGDGDGKGTYAFPWTEDMEALIKFSKKYRMINMVT